MTIVDDAIQIREGEQLDAKTLEQYLRSVLKNVSGVMEVKQFPGGASNLTYLIRFDNNEFVLRRPPFGKVAKSAHDMIREASVLETLRPFYPYVPKVLNKCMDQSIMGCDFFVMERLKGIIPRRDLPGAGDLNPSAVREFCQNGIDKLVDLHSINVNTPQLQALGKGTGYIKRQIDGWCDRWYKASTDDAASFAKVMLWLQDNQPEDIKNCVIHNDFRFDNLVYDADHCTRVIGVLDWEMATLGDPLMDLGNSLAYWIEASDPEPLQNARMQPTHLQGMFSRREVIDYYLEKSEIRLESFDYYEIYGLFRLAVIVQQIYYRYLHGQTQDKRFAGFANFAKLLEQRCLQLIAARA